MLYERNKRWTRSETEAAVNHIISIGGDDAMLARIYGSSRAVWQHRLKRMGIESPSQHQAKARKAMRAATKARVIEYLGDGHTQAEATRRFSVSAVMVSRWAAEAGLSQRKRITKAEMPHRDMTIIMSSKSNQTLADEFECSKSNIRRIRNKSRKSLKGVN